MQCFYRTKSKSDLIEEDEKSVIGDEKKCTSNEEIEIHSLPETNDDTVNMNDRRPSIPGNELGRL